MQQYSPKNQAFLLAQMPTATDVRPFKAWKAAGRSVRKGEKALRVWIPKHRNTKGLDPETMSAAELDLHFTRARSSTSARPRSHPTPAEGTRFDSLGAPARTSLVRLCGRHRCRRHSRHSRLRRLVRAPGRNDSAEGDHASRRHRRHPAGAVIAEYQHITA